MTRPQPRADHARAERARAEERALQVGVDHRVPVGLGQLLDRAADVDAGVVDQDVDRPELALRRRRRAARRPRASSRRPQSRAPVRPVAAAIPSAASWHASTERPESAMSAPASASAVAIVRPSPRAPPVTSAIFPSSRKLSKTFLWDISVSQLSAISYQQSAISSSAVQYSSVISVSASVQPRSLTQRMRSRLRVIN